MAITTLYDGANIFFLHVLHGILILSPAVSVYQFRYRHPDSPSKWASRSTNGRHSTSAAQPPAVVFLAPLMLMINIEWSDKPILVVGWSFFNFFASWVNTE
jgi:hypothetical protein